MIVPPFFGLYLPYKEREIYGLKHSYLSTDVLTYAAITNKLTITYVNSDILSYTIVDNPINITWLSSDVLSYSRPTSPSTVSYCVLDILSYEPLPEPPLPPDFVTALDGDSLVYLSWTAPYDNRSPLTDYVIQYKNVEEFEWGTVSDGINVSTSLTVDGLTNNITYEFRVAAVNSIGTGLYGFSNTITPSGGDSSPCSVKLLIQPDAIDVGTIDDLSCSGCVINHIGIESDSDNYQFGGRSLLFDGQIDVANDPNQFPYFSTAHHLKATRDLSSTNNLFWSLYNDFTIEMWLRPDGSNTTANRTLLSAYSQENFDYSNYSYFKIYLDSSNRIYFNVNLDYYDYNTGDWTYQSLNANTNFIVSISNFTHFTVCRSNGYLRLYINGNETYQNYFPYDIPLNTDWLIIGADHTRYNYSYDTFEIGRVYTENPFVGNIDDILISRGARYRKNFIPAQYSNVFNCAECYAPGPVTNLTVDVVDGV
jgi:hypothetical protein